MQQVHDLLVGRVAGQLVDVVAPVNQLPIESAHAAELRGGGDDSLQALSGRRFLCIAHFKFFQAVTRRRCEDGIGRNAIQPAFALQLVNIL